MTLRPRESTVGSYPRVRETAERLNTRPRHVLDWQTAHELFYPQLLAAWRSQGHVRQTDEDPLAEVR